MAQRYIYLTEELNQLLKQESNASALITRLLWDYYNSLKVPDVNDKIKQVEELQKEIENKSKEIEFIKEIEVVKVQQEETERIIKEKHDESTNKLRDAILSELSEDDKAKLEFEQ